MIVQYDPEANALYVEFSDKPHAYTEDVSRGQQYERGIDYAEDHTPIGIEFLNVSRGVDLTDIPRAADIEAALAERNIPVIVRNGASRPGAA
jgi:uncharacterized protein YuzE